MKQTTDLFKALAHRTRLQIICLLLEGEVCVCKIMQVLDLPQSTVSRHLAVLKNAGLLEDRRDGTWVLYSLAKGHDTLVDQLLDMLESHLPNTREGAMARKKLLDSMEKRYCS